VLLFVLLQTSLQAQTLARRQNDLAARYQNDDVKKEKSQSLKMYSKTLKASTKCALCMVVR
jgi:hypothetical protein